MKFSYVSLIKKSGNEKYEVIQFQKQLICKSASDLKYLFYVARYFCVMLKIQNVMFLKYEIDFWGIRTHLVV